MPATGSDLALIACTAAGMALTWFGWRGQLINDHPHCRRCGFDLFGLPATSIRCSECGADVTRRRARRVGLRRRRGGMFAGGVGHLLIALAGAFMSGAVPVGSLDPNSLKPFVLLSREFKSDDAVVREVAMAELTRRMGAKQLSATQTTSLINDVLALQADPSREWVRGWGDFLENANGAALVTGNQMQLYVANARHPVMRVRPIVRRGDPVPYAIVLSAPRIGSSLGVPIYSDAEIITVAIDGVHLPFTGGVPRHADSGMVQPISTGGLLQIDADSLAKIPAGAKTLTAVIAMSHRSPKAAIPSAQRTYTLSLPLELKNDAETPIALNADPTSRNAVADAVSLAPTPRWEMPSVEVILNGRFNVNVTVKEAPVALGYDVLLHTPRREVRLGRLACPARGGGTFHFEGELGESGFGENMANIEFRPSLRAAAETLDYAPEISGHRIVHRVLLVERPDPRLRHAAFMTRAPRPIPATVPAR